MRQVSSKMTFFYKRVFPVIWFGFLLLFIGFALFSPSRDSQDSSTPFLIVALLMAVFGFWFMKKVIFNLADTVLDAGDALVVRSGGQEERIVLSDIGLHVPTAGHPVGAAAHSVRGHGRLLRPRQHIAFMEKPGHRRPDRPRRRRAPEMMTADDAVT